MLCAGAHPCSTCSTSQAHGLNYQDCSGRMDALGSFQTVPVLIRRISDSDLTSYCQMISVNYIFSVSQSDSETQIIVNYINIVNERTNYINNDEYINTSETSRIVKVHLKRQTSQFFLNRPFAKQPNECSDAVLH